MAEYQIHSHEYTFYFDGKTTEILAASSESGATLIIDGPKAVVRVRLSREEARELAAKLTPHIP